MIRRITAILLVGGLPLAAAADPPPEDSVIVPIDLKKASIHVVTTKDLSVPKTVKLDVGFSRELLERPKKAEPDASTNGPSVLLRAKHDEPTQATPSGDYELQQADIRVGDEFHAVFNEVGGRGIYGRVGGRVGARITLLANGNRATVEIQPRYVLPDGTVQVLTTEAIRRTGALLSRRLAEAQDATPALLRLDGQRERLQADHDRAVGLLNSNDPQARLAAQITVSNYPKKLDRLDTLMDKARDARDSLPSIETDTREFDQISEYAATIAPVASIYIRLHVDGVTVPAEISK